MFFGAKTYGDQIFGASKIAFIYHINIDGGLFVNGSAEYSLLKQLNTGGLAFLSGNAIFSKTTDIISIGGSGYGDIDVQLSVGYALQSEVSAVLYGQAGISNSQIPNSLEVQASTSGEAAYIYDIQQDFDGSISIDGDHELESTIEPEVIGDALLSGSAYFSFNKSPESRGDITASGSAGHSVGKKIETDIEAILSGSSDFVSKNSHIFNGSGEITADVYHDISNINSVNSDGEIIIYGDLVPGILLYKSSEGEISASVDHDISLGKNINTNGYAYLYVGHNISTNKIPRSDYAALSTDIDSAINTTSYPYIEEAEIILSGSFDKNISYQIVDTSGLINSGGSTDYSLSRIIHGDGVVIAFSGDINLLQTKNPSAYGSATIFIDSDYSIIRNIEAGGITISQDSSADYSFTLIENAFGSASLDGDIYNSFTTNYNADYLFVSLNIDHAKQVSVVPIVLGYAYINGSYDISYSLSQNANISALLSGDALISKRNIFIPSGGVFLYGEIDRFYTNIITESNKNYNLDSTTNTSDILRSIIEKRDHTHNLKWKNK